MKRPGSFGFSGLPVAPWNAQRAVPDGGAGKAAAGPRATAGSADPIRDLLKSLRGREVVLQVGDRLVVGKLITYDPVLLVDAEGRSTLVRVEAIHAVTF